MFFIINKLKCEEEEEEELHVHNTILWILTPRFLVHWREL